MFFTLPERSSIAPIESSEPANAAAIIEAELIIMPCCMVNIIASATVSFAPEEMPRT